MSLFHQAEQALAYMVEDPNLFGSPILVRNPEGVQVTLNGITQDIGLAIDPQTGLTISGRLASISLRISSLVTAGLGVPLNIAENDKKPWLVTVTDVSGTSHTFKVVESRPDATVGLVVCLLGGYR